MKLVIPSAGVGLRLGNYTKNFNKGLVTVGNQPAIIRIISELTRKFPINEVIVLTGYQAEYLEEVLEYFITDIKLTIIRVENFDGRNSSLSHTLKQAKLLLQCDFIFCANDTLCELPDYATYLQGNWLAYYTKKPEDSYQPRSYRSIEVNDQLEVSRIFPKSVGSKNIYIGLCYVHDFEVFWESFTASDLNTGEVAGLSGLRNIKAVEVSKWNDCGNIDSLQNAQQEFSQSDWVILEKEDEAIWRKDGLVVKQHLDPNFIHDRMQRLGFLPEEFIPRIKNVKKHSFSYEFVPGNNITSTLNDKSAVKLLDEIQGKLWSKRCIDPKKIKNLEALAERFYEEKTLSRVNSYITNNELVDSSIYINGTMCDPIQTLLQDIDWKKLASCSVFSWFHGDFHNENIIFDESKFTLIDWRQNFMEGEYEFGDTYYDLAKFKHGLLVSHPLVHKNLFTVKFQTENSVSIEIMQSSRLLQVNNIFENWLTDNEYCLHRVNILTALIYLNIAVLHEQKYGEFLFNYGRVLLQRYLNDFGGKFRLTRENNINA